MADQPMEGENAEVERRIQEERRVMRTAFEREWAERVALVGHAAAAPVAAQAPERERSTAKLCRPDMYDGKKNNLPDFLYKMELYLDANGISEATKEAVKLATNYLTSHAFTWWRLREIDVKNPESDVVEVLTWAAFKEAITAQFRVLDQGRRARTLIRNLRQLGSVRAYTQQFQALLLETPETAEVDRIHDYCAGLKKDIRAQVDVQRPTTVSQAIQIADAMDLAVYGNTSGRMDRFNRQPRDAGRAYFGPASMELGAMAANRPARGRGRGPHVEHMGHHHLQCRGTSAMLLATIVTNWATWQGAAPTADARKTTEPELGGAQAWAMEEETPKTKEETTQAYVAGAEDWS